MLSQHEPNYRQDRNYTQSQAVRQAGPLQAGTPKPPTLWPSSWAPIAFCLGGKKDCSSRPIRIIILSLYQKTPQPHPTPLPARTLLNVPSREVGEEVRGGGVKLGVGGEFSKVRISHQQDMYGRLTGHPQISLLNTALEGSWRCSIIVRRAELWLRAMLRHFLAGRFFMQEIIRAVRTYG